jgi:hypothetical protein
LFAGVLLAVRADLNEPLALCLALLGLQLAQKERWFRAGIAFALALLAKETALAFLAGAAAWLAWRGQRRQAAALLSASLVPALAWGMLLTAWLGESPLNTPAAAMELIPFNGLRSVGASPAMVFILVWVALPALGLGAAGAGEAARRNFSLELFVLLANAGLIALMPRETWINVAGALRAATGLAAASLLYSASMRPRLLPWLAAFWLVSGLSLLPAVLLAR